MSTEIIWSEQAAMQFVNQKKQIMRDSLHAAANFELRILKTVKLLCHFPKLGHLITKEQRELLIDKYRIIYQVNDDTIEILSFYHTSQIPKE